MTTEFTGEFYKCNENICGYIWDYNDFNCPNCGSDDFEDTNIREELKVAEESEKSAINKVLSIKAMIKTHDA